MIRNTINALNYMKERNSGSTFFVSKSTKVQVTDIFLFFIEIISK